MKGIKDHGKQLIEYNEFIKKDFNVDRDSIPLEEQKKVFNELIEKRSFEFRDIF